MLRLFRAAAVCTMAASLPCAALAAAVVESSVGDVRLLAPGAQKPAALKREARIATGSTLLTGTDGMVVLRFDDQQKVVLSPNSQLGIVDYHYRESAAAADRAELMLHRGAARVVSGLIPRRNQDMFVFRTPHVNLGVQGTDFTATIIGQSYWSVNEGAVVASTNVGRGVFGKGSYGRAAALDRLAAGVSSAGLPVAVLALFNEMNSPKLTAQLGPAPGGAMTAAAPAAQASAKTGGIGAGGMMAILGALAAALAAGGSGGGDSVPTTTHH